MSTYAAIFVMDEKTKKFNGVSVKYDGYVKNGVGETLFKYWNNYGKAVQLVSNTPSDIRELGTDINSISYFSDEPAKRREKFRDLSYDEMLNQGKQFDYLYVMMVNDHTCWDWKVQFDDGFHSVSEFFEY